MPAWMFSKISWPLYDSGGLVALYRVGRPGNCSPAFAFPSSLFPSSSAASVSPGLEQLAIFRGGRRRFISSFERPAFQHIWKIHRRQFFGFKRNAILLQATAVMIHRASCASTFQMGETSPAWEIPKNVALHSNGPVLLEYSYKPEIITARWDFEVPEAQTPSGSALLIPPAERNCETRFWGQCPYSLCRSAG